MKPPSREPRVWLHPLAGADWGDFFETVRAHRGYTAKGTGRLLMSALAISQRWIYSRYEDWRERQRGEDIRALSSDQPPIFIIGHWGSGTTWLHQLLAADPRHAWPDNGDCLMPHNLRETSGYLRWYLRHLLPPTRGFDAVPLSLEEPQEEEMALAALGPVSYFHSFSFPQARETLTREALFLETLSEEKREAFADAYRRFLARISHQAPGCVLLLKNPAATTRIPWLRQWFPGARFIHLVRDPYEVAAAALNRVPYLVRQFGLQADDPAGLAEYLLSTYEAVMRRYLRDRAELPAGALFETSYEALVKDPVSVVRGIRETLGLPEDEQARISLQEALGKTGQFRRQPRDLPAEMIERIRKRWQFSFEAWGYPVDGGSASDRPLTKKITDFS